jgi:cysteine desulfuration protein SufE
MQSLDHQLNELSGDFASMGVQDRLDLLLEFADQLPEVPQHLADHPDLLERVVECQSPVFLLVEVTDDVVTIHFTVPKEAPTTRGFASILHRLLNGRTASEVLAANDAIPDSLSLSEAVSPLRLRGMRGMLFRIKRQVEQKR